MTHAVFKLVYFVELVLISWVRGRAVRRSNRLAPAVKKFSFLDTFLTYLAGVISLIPLAYALTGWLDFANYSLPAWIGWLGAIIFAASGALLWKTHSDLGRSWTPSLSFQDGHYLVTDGIFQYLRHPIYSSHILWGIAQLLMLHNWIAGFAYLIVIIPRTLVRIRIEEDIMLEKFGDEYQEYRETTGAIFPNLNN